MQDCLIFSWQYTYHYGNVYISLFCLYFLVEELNVIATCLEHNGPTLFRCIQPANGLLNELISLEMIEYSVKDRLESLGNWEEINEQLIRLVQDNLFKCPLFLVALRRTGQEHVVNFLQHRYDTDCEYWSKKSLISH